MKFFDRNETWKKYKIERILLLRLSNTVTSISFRRHSHAYFLKYDGHCSYKTGHLSEFLFKNCWTTFVTSYEQTFDLPFVMLLKVRMKCDQILILLGEFCAICGHLTTCQWQEIDHKTSHTPSQTFALMKRPHDDCQFLYHNSVKFINSTVRHGFLLLFLLWKTETSFAVVLRNSSQAFQIQELKKVFSLLRF